MAIYDIIVIGGGPSGATFARFIDKKYKVLLLDKRNYANKNNFHIKSCGGLLNEKAQKLLSSLNYIIPTDILVNPQVFNTKVLDYDNNISKRYGHNYVNLDREKFDHFLLSQASSHVEIITDAIYLDFKREKNLHTIRYRMHGKLYFAQCKILVGADGGNSKVSEEINPHEENRYISIQKIYKKIQDLPHHYAIFDKEINNYYSWIIEKNDEVILGSILGRVTDKNNNANKKFDLLEKKIREKEGILGEFIRGEGTIIRRPDLKTPFAGLGTIPLIGESAGFISPSSSEGISFALKTGFLLADSLNKYGLNKGLKRYYNRTKSIIFSLKLKWFKAKLMYNPAIRNLIIRTGIFSNKEYLK
ncbi:FAD-binding protein [Fusobacterium sp. PH5-44]|uniref:FAD-binding protein n=1 Tax=unclassified Fusobacterium TaxID=2648384 RepID=UPI003D1D864E